MRVTSNLVINLTPKDQICKQFSLINIFIVKNNRFEFLSDLAFSIKTIKSMLSNQS